MNEIFILILILPMNDPFMVQKLSMFQATVRAQLTCKLPVLWIMINSCMFVQSTLS
jgi:hypothetical protein